MLQQSLVNPDEAIYVWTRHHKYLMQAINNSTEYFRPCPSRANTLRAYLANNSINRKLCRLMTSRHLQGHSLITLFNLCCFQILQHITYPSETSEKQKGQKTKLYIGWSRVGHYNFCKHYGNISSTIKCLKAHHLLDL